MTARTCPGRPDGLALVRAGEDGGEDGEEGVAGPSWGLLAALRLKHASKAERRGGAAFAILDGGAVSAACEALAWTEVLEFATQRRAGAPLQHPRPAARAFAAEQARLLDACASTARRRQLPRDAREARPRTSWGRCKNPRTC